MTCMPKKSEIWAVLDRVQALTGPDRAVDRAIMALFYTRDSRHIGAHEQRKPRGRWSPVKSDVWIDPATDKWVTTDIDGYSFTASLDQAVNLVARACPGQVWSVSNSDGRGASKATVRVNPLLSVEECEATPALSLISATLRALVEVAE